MEERYLALSSGKSADVLELFGGRGGVTKICVRRKMKAGPIVDLVYGFNLSSKKEQAKWTNYIKSGRAKVIVMGPPCTHFGSFSHLNKKHPGFEEKYEVSKDLADFAARLAMIQLEAGRDFLTENPQGSQLWKLPSWQKVLAHPRTVSVIHDQCMSGLTIPDRHNDGKPILVTKSTPTHSQQ